MFSSVSCLLCKTMCVPNECDTCSDPKFKEISRQARYAGRTLGMFLIFHCILAAARCLSFSFSAALTDVYVVLYGYYIVRRYYREIEAPPQPGLCLQCESQQMVMCFMMLLSIDFGLSVWTLVELLTNHPVIPVPVGLPGFDYRILKMWQWYSGVVVAIAVLVVIIGEIVSGWHLHNQLNEAEIDYRYAKFYGNNVENGQGGLGGGMGGGGGGMGGNFLYQQGRAAPSPVAATRSEPTPETKSLTTSSSTSELTDEEKSKLRLVRAEKSHLAALNRQNNKKMGTL